MLDTTAQHDQWVANLFQALLTVLNALNLKEDAPDIFSMYAHENSLLPHKPANAERASQLIGWLSALGANTYFDRLSLDDPIIAKETPPTNLSCDDYLAIQSGLLPNNRFSSDRRQYILLCGSTLLHHYAALPYYQNTYYRDLKEIYNAAQAAPDSAYSNFLTYIRSHRRANDFYPILTEIAFLQLRVENESDHGIVPISLNGTSQENFPTFIVDSPSIVIEDASYQRNTEENQPIIYQDQALHRAFFRLLKRFWIGKAREIDLLGAQVYERCLTILYDQKPHSEESFHYFVLDNIRKSQRQLLSENSANIEALQTDQWFERVKEIILSKKNSSSETDGGEYAIPRNHLMDRLAIQQVSGQPLSIKDSYVDLDIKEYQATQHAENLPNTLIEHSTDSSFNGSLSLAAFFKPRQLKSGKIGIPRRILIRGEAGIGKTTLVKRSVYEHIYQRLWKDQFEQVIWLPLSHLKGKPNDYHLKDFLYDEYFSKNRFGNTQAQGLCAEVLSSPDNTLFILDGYEPIDEYSSDCLQTLLNHPNVIITTQSHEKFWHSFSSIDLELEVTGFSKASVTSYLDNRAIVTSKAESSAIKAFIQTHPFTESIITIPSQLEVLVYSWDEIALKQSTLQTITGLYEVMIGKLWRKDLPHLVKDGPSPLSEQDITRMSFEQLESCLSLVSSVLESLALRGFVNNQTKFSLNEVDNVIDQLADHNSTVTLKESLTKLSCFQSEQSTESNHPVSYQFLHTTFQAFFAAKWLTKHLREERSLPLDESNCTPAIFIQQYKYNPRYKTILSFVAGLLPQTKLVEFFETLEQGPQDVIGIQHQQLVMQCLKESHAKLPKQQQFLLEATLYDWLTFELRLINGSHKISALASQTAFPEKLLLKRLQVDVSIEEKLIIIRTLQARAVLSEEAMICLMTLSSDVENQHVREAAIQALGQPITLSEKSITHLIALSSDEDWWIRELVAQALGRQHSLQEAGISCLITLSYDKEGRVRQAATQALGKQNNLSDCKAARLIMLSLDEDYQVQECGIQALGYQAGLWNAALSRLISLLFDDEWKMRRLAAQALGQQTRLSKSEIAHLIEISKDKEWRVRQAVTQALGAQTHLPMIGVDRLITLTQDKNSWVKKSALQALDQQAKLSNTGFEYLISLFLDKSSQIRGLVAQILGCQTVLSKAGIDCLTLLSLDTDYIVRKTAVKALGNQMCLSKRGIDCLIRLSLDSNPHIRALVAEAIGKQIDLPALAVDRLIALSLDEVFGVKKAALEAFSNHDNLSEVTIMHLIALSQDEQSTIKQLIASALGKQTKLPEAGIECLITFAFDKTLHVREEAVRMLKKQTNPSKAKVASLIALSFDTNVTIQCLAIEALGSQANLLEAGIMRLVGLSFEENTDVVEAAVQALGAQSNLPETAIARLIVLSATPDANLKILVAEALGNQSDLSAAKMACLATLCHDQNRYVREAAICALSHQASLSEVGLAYLLKLSSNEDAWISNSISKALKLHALWRGYKLIAKNPDWMKLSATWFILNNLKQTVPFYIDNHQLYFYKHRQLQCIPLHQPNAFKEAILASQQAVGIPTMSHFKLSQAATFAQIPSLRTVCP